MLNILVVQAVLTSGDNRREALDECGGSGD